MSDKTGGAAFPRPMVSTEYGNGSREYYESQDGMSLRDHFAGRVAPALITARIPGLGWQRTGNEAYPYSVGYQTNPEMIAEAAYRLADAMLKERAK